MVTIQTILHPTDFSPCSDLALQLAGSLARDYRARLVVLHVGRPPLRNLGGPTPVPPLPVEWEWAELEQQLWRRTVPGLSPGPEFRLVFAEPAGEAILRFAEEIHCDLIVLGTHGRTGLRRLLMGSVAEQVVRRAPCPVLSIRCAPPAEGPAGQEKAHTSLGVGG
jgi:nucleotide-binding universal stress UspA family protein